MTTPENSKALDLLAALSHQTNFSIGCYCAEEERCHRSRCAHFFSSGAPQWNVDVDLSPRHHGVASREHEPFFRETPGALQK